MALAQISYIDGRRFKRALIAAARRVIQFKDQLNTINVFPVPDSDTGTNMAGTLHAVINALLPVSDRSLAVVSRAAADSALLGARGNSGTILAQFFHGMAEELTNHANVNTQTFARVVNNAVKYAYDAITSPAEGTILTVLRTWSDKIQELCRKTSDFSRLVGDSVASARIALSATKDRLPSLKKAGVVDAGAQGFVHMIEGVANFMRRGKIREIEGAEPEAETFEDRLTEYQADITFRFCTECIIDGPSIDQSEMRALLAPLGDSLIVAGSSTRTKVHIHTDVPARVFEIADRYGMLSGQKADDMHKQYEAAHSSHGDVAIVVDSACDLPDELLGKPYIHMVSLKVMLGEKTYIDKVSLTSRGFYEHLRSNSDTFPTTSQPAPNDYVKLYNFLLQHYNEVLVLSLSGGLSGTCSTARTAAAICEKPEHIHVVDTKNVSVAIGLIVRRIAGLAEAGASIAEMERVARNLAERTRLLVTVRTLDFLIRGGRVGRTKGLFARMLRVMPILTINDEGKAESIDLVRGASAGRQRIVEMIRKHLGQRAGQQAEVAIAHVDAEQDAREMAHEISLLYPGSSPIFVKDAAPVLATHTGFGTIGVAYIEPEDAPAARGNV